MLEAFPAPPDSNTAAIVPNGYRWVHSNWKPYWLIGKKVRTIFPPKLQLNQRRIPRPEIHPDIGPKIERHLLQTKSAPRSDFEDSAPKSGQRNLLRTSPPAELPNPALNIAG